MGSRNDDSQSWLPPAPQMLPLGHGNIFPLGGRHVSYALTVYSHGLIDTACEHFSTNMGLRNRPIQEGEVGI